MPRYSVLTLCIAVGLTACDNDKPAEAQAQKPEQMAPAPAATSAPAPAATTKNCGSFTPHFPYDSDEPLADDQRRLAQLAQCLKVTLREREAITLVGRADDRGSEVYNYWLGLRRAQQVRNVLVDEGVASHQIKLHSVGKQGAKGHLEGHSHAEDRRVDLVAKQGSPT